MAKRKRTTPSYPPEGTEFDLSSDEAFALPPDERIQFVGGLLPHLHREAKRGTLRLKQTVDFRKEMRAYRKLARSRPDAWLHHDALRWKLNVLGVRSPAHSEHSSHSAEMMAKISTSIGHLPSKIREATDWFAAHNAPTKGLTAQTFQRLRTSKKKTDRPPDLVTRIYRLLDVDDEAKELYRSYSKNALLMIYGHLAGQFALRSAFPPFHARFLVDLYAPASGDVVVLDPCAGWGGRLLGALCVPRLDKVTYVGVDPNRMNQSAYKTLTHRVTHYLKTEKRMGPRAASVTPLPFEDWLLTKDAIALRGRVDVAITSPPYGVATEIYEVEDDVPAPKRTKSANRYTTYAAWVDGFLKPMCDGVAEMLKPDGVFLLNIANVKGKAPRLENDANRLLLGSGLVREKGVWKLAMSKAVGTQALNPKHYVLVDDAGYRYEPVLVWRKPEDWSPRQKQVRARSTSSPTRVVASAIPYATKRDLPAVMSVFKENKRFFPHVRQDAIGRRVSARECLWKAGVVLTFQ